MTHDTEHMRKWVRHNLVLFLLGCFLLIDVLSLGIVLQTPAATPPYQDFEQMMSGDDAGKVPLKISEIKGPMIDEEAAMIVTEENETLPLRLWVFLLISYAALLAFNLSYRFEETLRIQWGWEAMLTLLFLFAWYVWDGSGAYLWYPLAVIKTGFLIFAIYLYLFDRKMLRLSLEEERMYADETIEEISSEIP